MAKEDPTPNLSEDRPDTGPERLPHLPPQAAGALQPAEPVSIDERIRFFRSRAAAPETRRAYQTDLRRFSEWGGWLPGWPAAEADPAEPGAGTPAEQLERYLAQHGDRLKIATLRRRVAAINKWNLRQGCAAPGRDERVRLQLAGIARAQRQSRSEAGRFRVRRAPPLLEPQMRALLDQLGDGPRDRRDRALFLLAWALGTRRSELLRLCVEDLQFDRQGLDVQIAFSKTDPEGAGAVLGVPRIAGRGCPVAALESWLHTAGIHAGALFRRIDRWGRVGAEPMTDESLGRILKQRLAQAGVAGAERFCAHSFRAGMITQGILDRADSLEVQERSRHQSRDVFQQYVRRSSPKLGSFVGAMLGRL
jgi:integrase